MNAVEDFPPLAEPDEPPHPAHVPLIRILKDKGCDLPDASVGRFLAWAASTGPLFGFGWYGMDSAPRTRPVDIWATMRTDDGNRTIGQRFADCRWDGDDSPTQWAGLPRGWTPVRWADPPAAPDLTETDDNEGDSHARVA